MTPKEEKAGTVQEAIGLVGELLYVLKLIDCGCVPGRPCHVCFMLERLERRLQAKAEEGGNQ